VRFVIESSVDNALQDVLKISNCGNVTFLITSLFIYGNAYYGSIIVFTNESNYVEVFKALDENATSAAVETYYYKAFRRSIYVTTFVSLQTPLPTYSPTFMPTSEPPGKAKILGMRESFDFISFYFILFSSILFYIILFYFI
jgi:hypothetical protein